jgi:glutathione S-transferase
MSSSDIITYSYPESPYAFKMHSIISLCGIKNYRNVPVSRVLPRPALAAIGVNYRRIPVMAVGKDVYCDSQAIIDYLVSTSSNPNIIGNASSDYAMKLLGDTIFRAAVGCFPPQALTPEFLADRVHVFRVLGTPEFKSGELRPQGLTELRSIFTRFEQQSLGQGKKFICGDEPTLQDAHVAWAVRFVLMSVGLGKEPGFGKDDMLVLYDWMERFIEATKFAPKNITAEEATKEILSAQPSKLGSDAEADPTGLKVGEKVAVNQTDADKTHPVEGKLVHLGINEVVVEVDSGVRVHLPRVGQKVEKARANL